MKTTRTDLIIRKIDKDEPSPNTREASAKRQEKIDADKKAFFSKGGSIKKLKSFHELYRAK